MKSNRKFISLAIGFALMTSLAACSTSPSNSGDAMKKDGDAMKGGDAMKKDGDAMKGGDAMKKDGDAMKGGDAMKKDGEKK